MATCLAFAASCGDGGTGPTTTTATTIPVALASVAVTLVPNPVRATLSFNSDFPWEYGVTVVLTETAGLGGSVDFINTVLVSPIAGEGTPFNISAAAITQRAGTNHVNANSLLNIPFFFHLTAGGRNPNFIQENYEIQFTDERGNVITGHAQLRINAPASTLRSITTLAPAHMEPYLR